MKIFLLWLAGAALAPLALGQSPVDNNFEGETVLPPIGIVPAGVLQEAELKIVRLERQIEALRARAAANPAKAGAEDQSAPIIAALQKQLATKRRDFASKLEQERNRFAKREQSMVARINEMEKQRATVTDRFQRKMETVQTEFGRRQGELTKQLAEVEKNEALALQKLAEAEKLRAQNNEAWEESNREWHKKIKLAVRTMQVRDAQAAVANTARLAEDWQNERQVLEAQVSELQKDLAKLQGMMGVKGFDDNQTELLRQGLQAKSKSLATLGDQAAKLAQDWRLERESASRELAAMKSQFEKATGDVGALNKKVAVLERTLGERNASLKALTAEAEKLSKSWEDQRGGLQMKISTLQGELKACQVKLETALASEKAALEKGTELKEEKQGLLSETRDLEKEETQVSKQLAEQIAAANDLQQKLTLAKEREEKLKTDLKTITGQQSSLTDEVARFRQEKKADQKVIAGLRDELAKAREQYAAAERDLAESDKKLRVSQNEVVALQEKGKTITDELAAARAELVKAKAQSQESAQLQTVVQQKEERVEQLEDQLSRLMTAQQELEATMIGTLRDYENLQRNYLRLQSGAAGGTEAMKKALASQKAAEAELVQIRKQLAEKEKQLQDARKRIQEAEDAQKKVEADAQNAAQAGKAALGKREAELQAARAELGRLQLGQQVLLQEAKDLRTEVLTIAPVRYELASSDVAIQQQRVLAEAQEVLAVYPESQFEIIGHTCNLGSKEGNLKLSRARAEGLRDFLLRNGVPEKNFSQITGIADEQPEASNETDAGRQKNRRVEIKVANPPAMPDFDS